VDGALVQEVPAHVQQVSVELPAVLVKHKPSHALIVMVKVTVQVEAKADPVIQIVSWVLGVLVQEVYVLVRWGSVEFQAVLVCLEIHKPSHVQYVLVRIIVLVGLSQEHVFQVIHGVIGIHVQEVVVHVL
jgi:hypothetical protein